MNTKTHFVENELDERSEAASEHKMGRVESGEHEGMCPSSNTKEGGNPSDEKKKAAKGWFITVPQCPIPKEVAYEQWKKNQKDNPIKEYFIVQEHHKDQGLHLHAFIKVERKMRFKKDRFDLVDEDGKVYHANIQIARSAKAVIGYCGKEDKKPVTNINVKSYMNKRGKLTVQDLTRPITELLEENIISPYQIANVYRNQCVYRMILQQEKPCPPPELRLPKRRHFWIYGPTNSGKTTKIRNMINNIGGIYCFQIPYNNDWVGYTDQDYLYADEFRGQLTVQDLNRICDGGAKLNVKGASVQIEWNVIVIICSNYSIRDCYFHTPDDVISTLYSRFNEIKLPFKIDVDEMAEEPSIEQLAEQAHIQHTMSLLNLVPEN